MFRYIHKTHSYNESVLKQTECNQCWKRNVTQRIMYNIKLKQFITTNIKKKIIFIKQKPRKLYVILNRKT